MMMAWPVMIWREYVYKVRKRQERFTCCHLWWMFPLVPMSGQPRQESEPHGALLPRSLSLTALPGHNVIMYHFLNYISTLMPSSQTSTHSQPVLSAFCLVKRPCERKSGELYHNFIPSHFNILNFHWLFLKDETKSFILVELWKCRKVVPLKISDLNRNIGIIISYFKFYG